MSSATMVLHLERELDYIIDPGVSFGGTISLRDLIITCSVLGLIIFSRLADSLIDTSDKQCSLVFICCKLCQQILNLRLV